jgi:hypothetical protein
MLEDLKTLSLQEIVSLERTLALHSDDSSVYNHARLATLSGSAAENL